ncbi:MAG: DUF1800 family protein, partial [Chloroflexota bacterium]
MNLSRRDFLKLTGLVAASTALASCAPANRLLAPLANVAWPALAAADFLALNRLTFGPNAEERVRFAQIGLAAWIEEQLAPESIDDFGCEFRLRNLGTLGMSASDLFDISDQIFDNVDRLKVPQELRQATLLRQVYSRRQLFEVMAEFWSDHFNISTEKGDCYYLKTVDDREVIRRNALGSFRDLVWASAHSPAMLVYLDNQANTKGAPNENYARELMELHTLGVEAGYSQQDVMELARCLTGWTVKEHFWRGQFTFDADLHDTGGKRVLGMEILEAGQAEAERVIERLAEHPAAARFVSTKLARRFLADDPPVEIIGKAAKTFEQTHGDIRAVLRVILLDGLNPKGHQSPLGSKYKRPNNFIASALRALNAETDGGEAVQEYLLRLGQVPFLWPTPDGYPDHGQAWQGNLLPRWQFAFALAQNEMKGTQIELQKLMETVGAKTPEESADQIASLLLGSSLETSARDELLAALRSAGADE